ncbi:GTPase ObgE [Candidatus Soleaferrea massiliensis]|uniref:GTPase ObgE n=1 Tax=Candidatus Soleaferrea massiliensis TaxID=1470354 RepID=UPI0005916449|nr:GTPase ObgE [Candidatus Soleaferrea massiliensis]
MFVDIVKIRVQAGKGGDGAVSFHREKYVSAGGPDGGDGGKGGNVVLRVDTNLSTLVDFKYRKNYAAEDGQNGRANRCFGKSADDLIIRVPKGTLVKEAGTGRIVADMSSEEDVVIAKGGRGGWGNAHFATPTRQVPRFAKPGLPGEQFDLVLELKLLADVGLIGFPNVGKSTLISVVSEAKPKIANYHFTTLVPTLGVVRVGQDRSFVMADIPGLIEGASEGVGLGHEFLRHVDRCRMLLHIVDVSGMEGRDPIEDFEKINLELKNFNEELAERPQMVAANKSDLAAKEQIDAFRAYIEEKGMAFYEISAATRQGTEALVYAISRELEKLPPIKQYEAEAVPESELPQKGERAFTIRRENETYVVEAPWLTQALSFVNMDDYESLQYFQRVLRDSGIIDKLEEMGIKEGDTVDILGFEFDYVR